MLANLDNLASRINAAAHRREDHFRKEIAVLDAATGRAIVTARVYATDRAAYACIWIRHGDRHGSGSARATGYGYHRASAALDGAIRAAGVTLSRPIDGVGDTAMVDACEAIGRAICNTTLTHIAHP